MTGRGADVRNRIPLSAFFSCGGDHAPRYGLMQISPSHPRLILDDAN
jgi:hypothetical protein